MFKNLILTLITIFTIGNISIKGATLSNTYTILDSNFSKKGKLKEQISISLSSDNRDLLILEILKNTKFKDKDGNVLKSLSIKLAKDGNESKVKIEDGSGNSLIPTRKLRLKIEAPEDTTIGDRLRVYISNGDEPKKNRLFTVDENGFITVSLSSDRFKIQDEVTIRVLEKAIKKSKNSKNSTPPTITLNGKSNISVILGNEYIENGAEAVDENNNSLSVDINSSSLEINRLGTYYITYSATDENGNTSSIQREVNIVSPQVLIQELNVDSEACKTFEKLYLDTQYTLDNNDWGRKYLDDNADGIQCVFSFKENNQTKGGWYWGWPYNNDYKVKGYPEAIYGAKFKRIYNEESGFPALVEMINGVEVDLEYRDLNITNRYNIALEFWLHTDEATSMDNIKYEVMFRFDPDGFHPKDVWKSVNIDGIDFDVYRDGEYGDSRVFINFVAKKKIDSIKLDLKKGIDFLIENGFVDMPTLYMSGVEMGVEVIYGSGVLILDKFNTNLEFNSKRVEADKLEESFISWVADISDDIDLDKATDTTGTNWKWRASVSNLELRQKNGTLVQRASSKSDLYFFTIFDTTFDMSSEYAGVKFTGVLGDDYNYRVMLYDGNSWVTSSNSFDSNFFSLDDIEELKLITEGSTLVEAFSSDGSIPSSLTFNENSSSFDFSNIKGFGLYYTLKDEKDSGYFKMDTLSLYKELPKFGLIENIITQREVSPLIFGLCTTPSRDTSTNEAFINNYREWVKYLRWPGGLMIENYDLKYSGSSTTYSVGKWTAFMKDAIPTLDFLIGVSSSKGAIDDENVTEYGYGLVNYLNVNFKEAWGDNEALDKPLPLRYVEIGNEPDLVADMTIDGYGKALSDYAKGIHSADPSVKILAPTTTYGGLHWMLPNILKDYGDNIDIVSIHDYADDTSEYQSYFAMTKNYIQKYMSDNERRDKDDIKIALTEYNSLTHLYRKGVFHEESWAKVIWHAQAFSYIIQEGIYMASLWHSYINGGHALYTRDGTPYPLHYSLKLWSNKIDFNQNPKVALSNSKDKNILITSVKMDNKLLLFVVNNSPYDDKKITISFKNHQFSNSVTVTTLTHKVLDSFYDEKEVASNVDTNKLRYYNPDAKIWDETDDDNETVTKVQFPNIDVITNTSNTSIVDEELTYTFPKYTLTVLEMERE